MKKWISLLLTLATALSLAACGTSDGQVNSSPSSSDNPVTEQEPETPPADEGTEPPAIENTEPPAAEDAEGTNILVAYFS